MARDPLSKCPVCFCFIVCCNINRMILASFPFLFNSMYRSLMIMLQNLGRCSLVHLTVPLLVDSSQLSAVVTLLYLLLLGPSNHTDRV